MFNFLVQPVSPEDFPTLEPVPVAQRIPRQPGLGPCPEPKDTLGTHVTLSAGWLTDIPLMANRLWIRIYTTNNSAVKSSKGQGMSQASGRRGHQGPSRSQQGWLWPGCLYKCNQAHRQWGGRWPSGCRIEGCVIDGGMALPTCLLTRASLSLQRCVGSKSSLMLPVSLPTSALHSLPHSPLLG